MSLRVSATALAATQKKADIVGRTECGGPPWSELTPRAEWRRLLRTGVSLPADPARVSGTEGWRECNYFMKSDPN